MILEMFPAEKCNHTYDEYGLCFECDHKDNKMNFNRNDTAASILPSLPDGMELRLKASQSNLTAFVSRISEEDQAEDKRKLMLKIEMAKTELRSLTLYGYKMAFYHDKPDVLKTDINTARGKLELLEGCLKESHG